MLCSSAVFYCIYLSSSLSRLSLFLTLSRNKVVIIFCDHSSASLIDLYLVLHVWCLTVTFEMQRFQWQFVDYEITIHICYWLVINYCFDLLLNYHTSVWRRYYRFGIFCLSVGLSARPSPRCGMSSTELDIRMYQNSFTSSSRAIILVFLNLTDVTKFREEPTQRRH